MRYLFGFLCVCALGVMPLVGCSETSGEGGSGGSAGSGGTGAMPECESAEDCGDSNQCTGGVCAEGVCECMPVEDGTQCSLGELVGIGVCVAGECGLACETAADCNDGNDCTEEDACPIDGGGVCDSTSVADGTPCAGGSCQGGACELTGSVLPCSEQGIRNAVAAGGGPYTFDCDGPTTVVTRATIVGDKDVILDGEGNLTVDGNKDHGVFSFDSSSNGCLDTPPCESEVRVELSGVTVTGGMAGPNPTFNVQECVDVQLTRSRVTGNAGRGIENGGTLTMSDVTVSDNEEGIFNFGGILSMTNCTVSGNTGTRPGSGGIIAGGILTMTNCTVSGNTGSLPEGGGIVVGGTVRLMNCTVSGNTAGNTSGDIVFLRGTVTMTNTLVDGACVEVEPTVVTSNGYNIESPGSTCGFDPNGTDEVSVSADDLNLGELAANGGPTMTHKPGDGGFGDGSAAINKIPAADCEVDTDQRGKPRPETGGTMCDVGSVEVQPEL